MKYFDWIGEVMKLLELPIEKGADFVEDVNWFGCYDDGMTPEAAIIEAKEVGVLDYYIRR
jgi:hypothetical protein